MTTQNKKMYYLFSIAADPVLDVDYEYVRSLVVLFLCLCGTWFSSFESCCQNYVYIHTYTIHFHQREKEKNMSLSCCWIVVILLSSNMTFETRCVEYNSVLSVDRYKPMTRAECHFKGFQSCGIKVNCWPTHWSKTCWQQYISQQITSWFDD